MATLHSIDQWLADFRGGDVASWMIDHIEVPVVATAVYMFMVLWIPKHYMASREAMPFRAFNIVWNVFLTLFSFVGAYYTLPRLFDMFFTPTFTVYDNAAKKDVVRHGNLYECVCHFEDAMFFDGPVGFFVCAFCFSKIPEMIDTFLLVFQKKRIIFLHWYHHITVMLYCWHAFMHKTGGGLVFAGLNYSVHSIMYFYYFMCSIGQRKVVRPFAPLITSMQILQMVVGTFVELYSLYHIYMGRGCDALPSNIRLGALMYISYFVLFSELFYNSYMKSPAKGEKKGSKKSASQAVQNGKTL